MYSTVPLGEPLCASCVRESVCEYFARKVSGKHVINIDITHIAVLLVLHPTLAHHDRTVTEGVS